MSQKRRVKRSVLRVVGDDEGAFKELLALIVAYTKVGVPRNELQAGFTPRKSNTPTVMPFVIVGKPAEGSLKITHRLDNFSLAGTSEQVEKRWRAWVLALVGNNHDIPDGILRGVYENSAFGRAGALDVLKKTLIGAGFPIGAGDGQEQQY